MKYFKVNGLTIETDLDFFQLIPCEDRGSDREIEQGIEQGVEKKSIDVTIVSGEVPEWIADREQERKYFEFGKDFSWLANNTCRFTVENGNQITYMLKEGKSEAYLKTYLLGYGMSMLALQKGQLAMHCAALSRDGQAVLICGEPGAGKSTLMTQLLKDGWNLMADDMAFVETRGKQSFVKPSFPFVKLCRDAAIKEGYDLDQEIYIDEDKDKFLVRYRGEFSLEEMPIKKLFYVQLSEESEVKHEEITGINSFYVCSENLFLRKLLGINKYNPELGQLSLKLAGTIGVYGIRRPKGKDTVREIVEIISRQCE